MNDSLIPLSCILTYAILRSRFSLLFASSCQAEKTYLRRVMRELSKCQTDAGVAGPDALVSAIFLSYILYSSKMEQYMIHLCVLLGVCTSKSIMCKRIALRCIRDHVLACET